MSHGKLFRSAVLTCGICLSIVCSVSTPECDASIIQVGTLVPVDTLSTNTTFDPGFGTLHSGGAFLTRQVAGAPVDIISDFSGTSGASGGASPDTNDSTLNIFSGNLTVRRLGRFGGLDVSGGARWNIDLAPLDAYLSSNSLGLTALDIQLDLDFTGGNSDSDIYLSYTDPAQSITLTEFATTSAAVGSDWINPAIAGGVGSIVNGSHEVIVLSANDSSNPHPDSIDLLGLYNNGVRELNLVFASESFWGGSDQLSVALSSGVYIDTAAIPEPGTTVALGLAGLGCLLRRQKR